jgi:DNA-binding response OmpR family regulator
LFHVVADRVALAILDIELPTMTGNELLATMRATRPGLRALLISGHPVERARATAGHLDGTAFLRKPFGISALMKQVRRLLQAA